MNVNFLPKIKDAVLGISKKVSTNKSVKLNTTLPVDSVHITKKGRKVVSPKLFGFNLNPNEVFVDITQGKKAKSVGECVEKIKEKVEIAGYMDIIKKFENK